MKSLLAALALLYASPVFINQANSNEVLIVQDTDSKEVDQSKKTYTSEGKEIQTVIAIGIGTSPQGAAQNAAENALTQVVGSFIDAETILTKKTEIRDGVVAKSKELSKKISDYSQGSIKSFEILNTSQNGSIYNVTARVDVRIEDFRAYIKELAFGSKKINTGLFSVIKTEESNRQEKLNLLANVINPVINGEVIDIKIGNPERFKEVSAFGCFYSKENLNISCPIKESKKGINQRIYTNMDKNKALIIPVTLSLKKDYLENAINILNNISDQKKLYEGAFKQVPSNYHNPHLNFDNYDSNEDYIFSVFKRESKEGFRYFLPSIKKLNLERADNQKVRIKDDCYLGKIPKLKFNFKDKDSNLLLSSLQKGCNDGYGRGYELSSSPKIRLITLFTIQEKNYIEERIPNHLFEMAELRDRIDSLLIIEPNEELLNNLHEISIEYVPR